MGSLPNLNELCEEKTQRRGTVERERDAVRERAQQLEFISRDYKHNRLKDKLPTLFQVKQSEFHTEFLSQFPAQIWLSMNKCDSTIELQTLFFSKLNTL